MSVSSPCRQCLLIGVLMCVGGAAVARADDRDDSATMLRYLESRVESRQKDGAAWRMLGRAYLDAGRNEEAFDCLRLAVKYAPDSAAAHFDLAATLSALGFETEAIDSYRKVIELAPESEYASEARQIPGVSQKSDDGPKIIQSGYEIRRFNGSDILRDRGIGVFDVDKDDPQPSSLIARFELGALYNSNVALTPSSRDLGSLRADSFQAIFSPQIEYWLVEKDCWRAGPMFSGDFSLNEDDFEGFNLQSYRPGLFVERSVFLESSVLVPRLQYVYSLDQFAGDTFDNRHALTGSVTNYHDDGDATVGYLSVNFTDFEIDGTTPSTTSRDGWTYGGGVSHTHILDYRFLSAVSLGTDFEIADADGSLFAYQGVSVFAATETPLTSRLSLITEGGWGYRHYPDAMVTPSRDENIWSAGTRLQYRVNDFWSLVGLVKYDRFMSDNPDFDSDRVQAGIVAVYEY